MLRKQDHNNWVTALTWTRERTGPVGRPKQRGEQHWKNGDTGLSHWAVTLGCHNGLSQWAVTMGCHAAVDRMTRQSYACLMDHMAWRD